MNHIKENMDVSERRVCRTIDQPRMTQHYRPKQYEKDKAVIGERLRLAGSYPRYGYRFITEKFRQSGCPWQNGYIESFNGRLRDEVLNREIFHSVKEAKVLVENWRLEYNNHRPHSGLCYKTPAEFAAVCIASALATPSPQ